MSRLYFNTVLLLIILAISHVVVWQMDKELHVARMDYRKKIENKKFHSLKEDRLQLEKLQKESLQKWTKEKNGYVQIPIDRAFDYYLRGLK